MMIERLSIETIEALKKARENAKVALAKLHEPVRLPGSIGWLEAQIASQNIRIARLEEAVKSLLESKGEP